MWSLPRRGKKITKVFISNPGDVWKATSKNTLSAVETGLPVHPGCLNGNQNISGRIVPGVQNHKRVAPVKSETRLSWLSQVNKFHRRSPCWRPGLGISDSNVSRFLDGVCSTNGSRGWLIFCH